LTLASLPANLQGARGPSAGYATGKVLINNCAVFPGRGVELVLQPYQAVVLELKPQ
jgi:hypothetical protein